jgi:hypothetical protein
MCMYVCTYISARPGLVALARAHTRGRGGTEVAARGRSVFRGREGACRRERERGREEMNKIYIWGGGDGGEGFLSLLFFSSL